MYETILFSNQFDMYILQTKDTAISFLKGTMKFDILAERLDGERLNQLFMVKIVTQKFNI